MYRPTQVNISLANLKSNFRAVQGYLRPGVSAMAVVKADAYGHGLVPVARTLTEAGADMLGVAIPEEGVALRKEGLSVPILVLGGIFKEGAEAAVQYGLTQTVFSPEAVYWLEQAAAKAEKAVTVHLKVDTGMGRLGVRNPKEQQAVLDALDQCPHVQLAGVFTHMAVADELSDEAKAYSQKQLEGFEALLQRLPQGLCRHAANSAAALTMPQAQYDRVRVGLAVYGGQPILKAGRNPQLLPVMTWHTKVLTVKAVSPGHRFSYGLTYTAPGPGRIATLPVGYADGYRRCLSNRGQVLIRGQRMPVVGTVCMDQMLVDVTALPEVQAGEPVVLLGTQGEEHIYAEEMADWCQTISYEIMCGVQQRVTRIYEG